MLLSAHRVLTDMEARMNLEEKELSRISGGKWKSCKVPMTSEITLVAHRMHTPSIEPASRCGSIVSAWLGTEYLGHIIAGIL